MMLPTRAAEIFLKADSGAWLLSAHSRKAKALTAASKCLATGGSGRLPTTRLIPDSNPSSTNTTTSGLSARRFCAAARSRRHAGIFARPIETFSIRTSAGWSEAFAARRMRELLSTELLVDFHQFWSRLSADIRSALRSVFVQTFAFEGDAVGKQLSEALVSSPAADKRILADSFTRIVLSDRFRYSPANLFDQELRSEARATDEMFAEVKRAGVRLKFTNAYGVTPRRLLSRNHKKLIVIDDATAYFGGINFSEHNAAWHDMMLRTDDADAVAFLRADFLSTWTGRDQIGRKQIDGIELFTLDGRANRAEFQRVLDLIDAARQTIFVESPYITFPFYEPLREAARRGVDVMKIGR